ncbi:hypothetical protein FOZ63_023890 [Perkinsus olseni]|uniref:Uncharacterized protein n=1 Tax=Perkinsus olseni TaxID=32597 RepID=A0A7J6U120_PEROL|nr:hypothetical protein FOZ63_023890 [Perkinsus olseni]
MASIPSSYERIFGGGQTGGSSRLVASLVTPRFSSLEEAAVVAPAGTNRSRSPFGLSRRRVLSARRESPICLSPTTSNRELFGKGFSRHQPPPIVNPSVTTARVRSQSQGARRMMGSEYMKALLSPRPQAALPELEAYRSSRMISPAGRRSNGASCSTATNAETPTPRLRTCIRTFAPENDCTSATRSRVSLELNAEDTTTSTQSERRTGRRATARSQHPVHRGRGIDGIGISEEDSNTSGLILFPASKVSVVPFVPPEPLRRRAHLAWPELSLTREPQSPWDDGSPRLNPNGVYPRSGNERDWLRKSGYTQRLHSARAEMMSCAGSGKLPSTQMHVPKNSPLLVKDTMQLNGELSREEMFASK